MARYDDLGFNNGTYIPQYQGIPLDTIENTADTLSQRHYQNIAEASKLEILANQMKSKLLPEARGYVDEHIDSINAALQQMAANGGENATSRINALSRALQSDQGLLLGLEKSQAYEQFKKTRDTLTSQGLDPVWNKDLEQQYLNAGITDPNTGEINSIYNSPFNLTAEKRLNYMEHQDKVLDKLQPDSWESELKAEADRFGMSVPVFLKSTHFQGLTSKKVQEYLFKPVKGPGGKTIEGLGWTSYKDSPEYRQQKMIGMTDDQIKAELQSRGEAKVFSQYDNSYMTNPIADDLLRQSAKEGQNSGTQYTYAPGQNVESLFDYDSDGQNLVLGETSPLDKLYGNTATRIVDAITGIHKEFSPQYLKDYKTMLEIDGKDTTVKPDSKEAKEAALKYKTLVQNRVSNPAVLPFTADQITDANKELKSRFALFTYMNPSTGEVIQPFDKDGKPTDEFIDLTGGDPSSFNVESIYGPKNHYTLNKDASEKFVTPLAVTAKTKDGKPVRFLASSLPGQTSPERINTNVIYTKANLRPGQEIEITPRLKVTELHGAQLAKYLKDGKTTVEELKQADMPLEATVDGEKVFASSAQDLAQYLTQLKNPIYLSIK